MAGLATLTLHLYCSNEAADKADDGAAVQEDAVLIIENALAASVAAWNTTTRPDSR
jgi:hypothetical protein